MMSKQNKVQKQLVIYQAKSGEIRLNFDGRKETIWASRMQMAEIFGVNPQAISKHLKNIYQSGELQKKATSSKMELVQNEAGRKIKRKIDLYSLDAIISVGYRINSTQATQFRIWATQTLKQHILQGYTINKKQIGYNYAQFMQAISSIKALLPIKKKIEAKDVLELVNTFASTWFSLESYDKNTLPISGLNKNKVVITAKELTQALIQFKKELISKNQATDIFGQERNKNSIEGIIGNVFQSVFGSDVYPTIEEKSANLLYFIIKNHPFVDGNKRSGAFAFVWFLQKTGLLRANLTPATLTTLTLLIAESDSNNKDKMIGLLLLLLKEGDCEK